MTADIKYIEDKEGFVFFPVTHENGVVDNNGTLLSVKLATYVTEDELIRLTASEVETLLNLYGNASESE